MNGRTSVEEDAIRSKEAYSEFERFMKLRQVNIAYGIFEENPNLIAYMPIGEFQDHYDEIKRLLGPEYSAKLIYSLLGIIEDLNVLDNPEVLEGRVKE
jgi:hypothetical protein